MIPVLENLLLILSIGIFLLTTCRVEGTIATPTSVTLDMAPLLKWTPKRPCNLHLIPLVNPLGPWTIPRNKTPPWPKDNNRAVFVIILCLEGGALRQLRTPRANPLLTHQNTKKAVVQISYIIILTHKSKELRST